MNHIDDDGQSGEAGVTEANQDRRSPTGGEAVSPGDGSAKPVDMPDTNEAVDFMRQWPTERMHLWFKKCDSITGEEGASKGRTYERTDTGYAAMRAAIDAAQGKFNCYFLVNDPLDSIAMDSVGKPSNTQMKQAVALHGDIDPLEGETQADALKRISERVGGYVVQPSALIASGGGMQPLWVLREPFSVDGDPAKSEAIKRYNTALADDLGGDHVGDVSRVLRLPGTINLPNVSKRGRGREPARARLIEFNGFDYPISIFKHAEQKQAGGEHGAKADIKIDWSRVPEHLGWLKSSADLPEDFPRKGRIIIEHEGTLADLNESLKDVGLLQKGYGSWNDVTFALAAVLKGYAKYTPEQIAAALMAPLPCNQHVTKLKSADKMHRPIERALNRSYDAKPASAAGNNGELLAEMNEKHCVLPLGGKARVATFAPDDEFDGRMMIAMVSSFDDFKNLNCNKYVPVGDDFVPVGAWWINHPKRRQYQGMKFMPQRDEEVVGDRLNLWRGFGVQAVKPDGRSGESGCKLFLDHMRDILCSRDEEHFDYLRKHLATIIQKRKRTEIAVGLRSKGEGTGKGFYCHHIGHLFGQHYMQVSNPDHVTGKHNPHLETLLMLIADEALFAGDPRHRNALFGLITEPDIAIEPKFYPIYSAKNYLNITMTSNADHFIPVGETARRFFVPTVSEDRVGDHAYFNAIDAQLKGERGYEALLYHLQHEVDIRDFNVRQVPKTAGLHQQASYSRKGVDLLVETACSEAIVPCRHHRFADMSITAGSEERQGFDYFIANSQDQTLKRLGPMRVKNILRDEWECKTGDDGRRKDGKIVVRGIKWPDLEDLRMMFEAKHGSQKWLADGAIGWLAGRPATLAEAEAAYGKPKIERTCDDDDLPF